MPKSPTPQVLVDKFIMRLEVRVPSCVAVQTEISRSDGKSYQHT